MRLKFTRIAQLPSGDIFSAYNRQLRGFTWAKMSELKRFKTKIETWVMPITMRAYNEHDAEGLARALFKVPTDVEITIVPEESEGLEE